MVNHRARRRDGIILQWRHPGLEGLTGSRAGMGMWCVAVHEESIQAGDGDWTMKCVDEDGAGVEGCCP